MQAHYPEASSSNVAEWASTRRHQPAIYLEYVAGLGGYTAGGTSKMPPSMMTA